MGASTAPAEQAGIAARSLRARWRWYLILGMNALVIIFALSVTLVLALEQRQTTTQLHESTQRHARAAVISAQQAVLQRLVYASRTIETRDMLEDDLMIVVAAEPVLRRIYLVDANGVELGAVPAEQRGTSLPWQDTDAWQAAMRGEIYVGLYEESDLVLMLSVPLPGGAGVLVAEADPALLWGSTVSPRMGDDGYVYLTSESGALLATGDEELDQGTVDFPSLDAAREGHPGYKIYRGLEDTWVVGRAERIPDTRLLLVTETPLTEFRSPLIRIVALWGLAFFLTAVVGEWLIQRILRTILGPLDSLGQAVQAIEAGDYRYHIRLPAQTDREFLELGAAFNAMINRLQASQREIDQYSHEVEGIIDLRARELSRKAKQLEIAGEVSSKIATILDPRALMIETQTLVRDRFSIYNVDIVLVDSEGTITLGVPHPAVEWPPLTTRDSGRSVIAAAARRGETIYVPDVREEPRYLRLPDLPAAQSELAIPLSFGSRVIGVLNLEADHCEAFTRDDIAVLESLANDIAVSLHNAQTFHSLETANRELAQASLHSKQANLLKSRFLLNASHKLRTPLNAIIGYSETILSGIYGEIPDKALDRQQRILENGRVLQALIEDMLDLTSIESGHMELNLAWIQLPPLLQEVMIAARALHQNAFGEHDLTLRLDLPPRMPPVWADLDRLRYVLINLMSNAVKFTQAGDVVMAAVLESDRVLIHVRDTGVGIGADELPYLFEPFQHQRGSTASSGKGTGLGLPVARLLAQMHHGDLLVDSTLHEGSTFTLWLPLHPTDAPPPPDSP